MQFMQAANAGTRIPRLLICIFIWLDSDLRKVKNWPNLSARRKCG